MSLLGLLLALVSGQPRAADCSKARGEAEVAICRTPELRELDRKLAEAYARTRNAIGSVEGKRLFAENQKAWLADRDRCGGTVPCLRDDLTRRIAWIASPLTAVAGVYTNGAYTVLVSLNDASLQPMLRMYTGKTITERGLMLMESEAKWIEPSDPAGEGEPAVVFRPIFLGAERTTAKSCTRLRVTFFMDDLMSLQSTFKEKDLCPWLAQQGKPAGATDYRFVRPVYDYTGPVR